MNIPSLFQRSRLTRILWAFRREFALVGLFSMLANLLMLAPTLYMLQIFDRVYLSQSELTLLAVTLLLVLFVAVMAFADWLRSRLLVRAGVQFDNALNERVFRAGFRAELEQTGHKSAQSVTDLMQIRQFLTGTGTVAFFDAPWTPIYIGVSWLLHPWLGVLAIIFVANLVVLAWVNQRRTAGPTRAASEAELEVNKFLGAKLRNAEVVESMGMLGDLRRRWKARHLAHLHAQGHAYDVSHRVMTLMKFMRYSQQSLSLGAGALLAIQGEISVGSMIAANVLMSRASQPLEMLVATWSQFVETRLAFGRLERLLEDHPEQAAGRAGGAIQGRIAFRGFSATVPGRAEPIIKPLDVEFPAGELVAIIGPSGSGKSTLARSILGIWPHTEGAVLIDGLPVADYDRDALGAQLGYLPQDVELFEGSIAENIARLSELDAPRVIEAAQRAGLHEMILRFPKGYDTPIGPGGKALSGGQRQRIALARAMYGDPRLLVLDEPNANLDDAGEAALITALQGLRERGSCVYLITHRLNALAVVDRVVVMQNGHIVANGPRDEVIAVLRAQQAIQTPPPQSSPGTASATA